MLSSPVSQWVYITFTKKNISIHNAIYIRRISKIKLKFIAYVNVSALSMALGTTAMRCLCWVWRYRSFWSKKLDLKCTPRLLVFILYTFVMYADETHYVLSYLHNPWVPQKAPPCKVAPFSLTSVSKPTPQ